jgi:translocation and assembly module TamA
MGALHVLSVTARLGCLLALLWVCPVGSIVAQELTATVATKGSSESINAALRGAIALPAIALEDAKPEQLLRLIQTDRERLKAVLHAYGFYEGRVDVLLNGKPLDTEANTAVDLQTAYDWGQADVLYVPIYGPGYRIGSIQVIATVQGTKQVLCGSPCPLADQFTGAPATAVNLASAEAEWLSRRDGAENGADAVVGRAVSPHRDAKTVDVVLTIDPRPQVRLGSVQFNGLQRIDPDALQRYVPFQPGDVYRLALIEHLRAVLEQSSLFQTIHIDVAEAPDAAGLHPVAVNLVERPQSISQFPLMSAVGIGVFFATAMVLATTLLAGASLSPFWRSLERPLNATALVFLLLSALVALERFLYLANI